VFEGNERKNDKSLAITLFYGNLSRYFLGLGCIEYENYQIKKGKKGFSLKKSDGL
jgi:hypothetical protein